MAGSLSYTMEDKIVTVISLSSRLRGRMGRGSDMNLSPSLLFVVYHTPIPRILPCLDSEVGGCQGPRQNWRQLQQGRPSSKAINAIGWSSPGIVLWRFIVVSQQDSNINLLLYFLWYRCIAWSQQHRVEEYSTVFGIAARNSARRRFIHHGNNAYGIFALIPGIIANNAHTQRVWTFKIKLSFAIMNWYLPCMTRTHRDSKVALLWYNKSPHLIWVGQTWNCELPGGLKSFCWVGVRVVDKRQ